MYPPTPLAKPTLLQYYCTTIGQYTPSYRPPFVCREPYSIGEGNIVKRTTHPSTFTRYCRYQYGKVYGIRKESRGGVVHCAKVVQSYCNRVSNACGRGNTRMID